MPTRKGIIKNKKELLKDNSPTINIKSIDDKLYKVKVSLVTLNNIKTIIIKAKKANKILCYHYQIIMNCNNDPVLNQGPFHRIYSTPELKFNFFTECVQERNIIIKKEDGIEDVLIINFNYKILGYREPIKLDIKLKREMKENYNFIEVICENLKFLYKCLKRNVIIEKEDGNENVLIIKFNYKICSYQEPINFDLKLTKKLKNDPNFIKTIL
ncbi:hypothetical protein BCR36DRAFT_374218 [Piromyces finnis]|uniref:Uncharacterized protein n=1 Tax=Piromyces finnis TaxID=1754191 RepID=A0A1Y1UYE1_9FUNG|nr:hypothetical protein BCR36DRAFT_374218 [Piromyces finnis]|eukprot:ORX42819.1 hypothetical protein BCR36DRAFT_374218 [Piromyces finnis]